MGGDVITVDKVGGFKTYDLDVDSVELFILVISKVGVLSNY